MGDDDIESLINAALTGNYAERARLLTFAAKSRSSDKEHFDDLLDLLAVRAGSGNDLALEILLELIHRLQLSASAIRSRVSDLALVDDIAQQTLITVERNITSYGGLARFRSWLYAVARNEALITLRRRQPQPTGEQLAPVGIRFTSVVANRLTIADIVDSLPSPYSETLRLQLFDDLDYEAIAVRLEVPVGTVRSRLAKAKDLMRRALADAPL